MFVTLLHQVGPWILLVGGIVGLLQLALFWRTVQRCGQRMLESELMLRLAKQSTLGRVTHLPLVRFWKSPGMWWLTAALSVAYVCGAAVWFALRP
jgi:hypothetical protein